jgi:uncharacterized protein (DUF305 family)
VSDTIAEASPHAGAGPAPTGGVGGRFGPLTGLRVVALLLAVAFLAGAVGWAVGQREQDPLSSTDVGFLRDMGYHHEQAVALSLIALHHDDVSDELGAYAQEIIVAQRYEQGIFNATLDRFGHSSEVGREVMGWMGPGIPADDMPGLASEEQVQELRDATGAEAEALWIALITEHHLAGLHMADWEARRGHDRTTRNIARAMVRAQRGEVIDLDRYRRLHDLPIPEGFSDPLADQRLRPLSLDGA